MSYSAFLAYFLVPPIIVLAALVRRRITRGWLLGVGVVMALALAYTGPWDHAIIAQGVWSYPAGRVLGPTIGLVPVEEYAFYLLQVALSGLVLLAIQPSVGRPVAPGRR